LSIESEGKYLGFSALKFGSRTAHPQAMHLTRAGVSINSGSHSRYPQHCGHRSIVSPYFHSIDATEQQMLLYTSTPMHEPEQKQRLLKAEEIAARLGLKVQTVYTMARRGELEKVKLSRKCLRFRADDVERFIERRSRI
jgi:excisionase family DNA binding protein